MARTMVPYGLLANGNYGINLDAATQSPLAAVFEILVTLPSIASVDNFDGRAVFITSSATPYVFTTSGPAWIALEGIPATVGNVAGSPPTLPTPQTGSLFWDLDTQVLFLWDGGFWQAAGGAFAATIVENTFIGDGLTVIYPSGATASIPGEYVEVFLDGVRQISTVDYNLVGTNVSFVTAPANPVAILIRALLSQAVIQTAQVASSIATASVSQTDFSTGLAGSDPAGVFVFLDGQIQVDTVDYNLIQQDTSIVSLVKTSATSLRATTTVVHNISPASVVTLGGITEPEYNNNTYTVTNVPTTTTFDVTVNSGDPGTGTGDPVMFYSPAFVNDIVRFVAPLGGGESVDIRTFRSVVVSADEGEANILGSTGAGVPLNTTKVGVTLQIKSLVAGSNIALVDNGTDVVISTASGLSFEDRVGINAFVYVPTTESYVGVRNTSSTVVIDLTSIIQDPINSGRRIQILDESGGAGVNNITIIASPARINGSLSPYVIASNHGSVILVMDGSDWYVAGTTP